MSYSQSFYRRVAVPYHGSLTVTYPASQYGGTQTVYYDGTAYEDVEVDVHVDTSPFDASVANCNHQVCGLTASVGAMNVAQCAAISENAEKVSNTIIDGFFHTVRTDLATQKIELEQVIEARLILLRQQAASLLGKQKEMEDIYARTTARYQKLFSDINNELSVRIHEIDQPVFSFVADIDAQGDRMLHTDMVQTAVTFGKECCMLQAQLGAAMVKYHALEAMTQAQNFLISKAQSEKTLRKTCIEGNGYDRYYIPVCFMKTESDHQHEERRCLVPDFQFFGSGSLEEQLCEELEEFDMALGVDRNQILTYVQSEISNSIPAKDVHSQRVRDMINILLNQ